ncbi:hypothetical protein ACVQTW_002941 [Klebsiella aerogenes]
MSASATLTIVNPAVPGAAPFFSFASATHGNAGDPIAGGESVAHADESGIPCPDFH